MEIKYIETKELLKTLIINPNKWVEARLCFNNISATHFLIYDNNKLYDEGIDGEERVINKNDFINNYENNFWLIDNII